MPGRSVCPKTKVSPSRTRLRRRSSAGSRPSSRARRAVHLPLAGERGLRHAEAAEGPVGRSVRGHGAAADARVRDAVGAGRVQHAARQHDRAERRVGAGVQHQVDVDGQQPAVPVEGRAVARARRVPLGRAGDVLAPLVDHRHRMPATQGQHGGLQGQDGRVVLLAAEGAAGGRLAHHDAVAVQAQGALHRVVDVVGTLQRAEDLDAAVGARRGDDALGLEVHVLLVAGEIGALDDRGGRGEGGVGVAAVDVVLGDDVVGRGQHVGHGRQRLREQPDVVASGPCEGERGGCDQSHRLTDVADLVRDQDRLIVLHEVDHVLAGDVGPGEDHHATPVEAGVALQPEQAGVRLRRPYGAAVPGPARRDRRCSGPARGPSGSRPRAGPIAGPPPGRGSAQRPAGRRRARWRPRPLCLPRAPPGWLGPEHESPWQSLLAATMCVPVSPASARSTLSGSVMMARRRRARGTRSGLDLRRHAARARSACPRRGTPRLGERHPVDPALLRPAEVERDLLHGGGDQQQLGVELGGEERAAKSLSITAAHAVEVSPPRRRRPGCRRRPR